MENIQENIQFPTLPDNEIVTIEVSGAFYSRVKGLLIHICSKLPQDQMLKVLNKLKGAEPVESEEESIIHILAAIVASVEDAAKTQGKVKYLDPSAFKHLTSE